MIISWKKIPYNAFVGVLIKKGQSGVAVKKASEYKNHQSLSKELDHSESSSSKKSEKLVNIIYQDGDYHLYEP